MQTGFPESIVRTTMKQVRNFDLTSRMFVGHVNLSLENSQATIFETSVDDVVQNP